jgi:hypothetical protein
VHSSNKFNIVSLSKHHSFYHSFFKKKI